MIFQVFRTHKSDYLGDDFLDKEEKSLKQFSGLSYCRSASDIDPKKPLILIGSSQSDYQSFSANQFDIKLVIHANSGFDNISINWCESLSAPIIICHEIRQFAVSEYVLSSLLHHFASLPTHQSWNRSWPRKLIADQKVLLLGLGHIGRIVYQSLLPLTQKIIISDPFKGWDSDTEDVFDIIINCTSLNPTTEEFINKKFLEKLNHQGVFINPARGQSVKELSLIHI